MLNYFVNKFKTILKNYFYKNQRCILVDSVNDIQLIEKYRLKKLIRNGNSVIGYVPYVSGQTDLIIFNFFAVNYGVRSKSTLVISIVDKHFKPIYSFTHELGFRNNFFHRLKPIDDKHKPVFCTALLINKDIRKDHGGHGGHFRFWGSWSNFSAFTHSMPNPHAASMLLKKLSTIFLGKRSLYDRRFFPQESTAANHFGYGDGIISVQNRGDLSSSLESEMGFSLLQSRESKVCACYHNSQYTRESINSFLKCDHIIALPDAPGIDAILYFGECCKPGARFLVSLFSSDSSIPIAEIEIEVVDAEAVKVSSIFPNLDLIGRIPCWLRFRPSSGDHRNYYINAIYSGRHSLNLYDGVHSHGFSNNSGRSLKFAPFKALGANHIRHSSLAIWGNETLDTRFRLRIFSSSDQNFEVVSQLSIVAGTLKFVDLIKLLGSPCPKFEFLIVQLESEESNLNASLFSWAAVADSRVESMCIDHLTGG